MDYDKYIVAFSGGKDSTACFLHLLDLGIPKEKIELWHHDIDGDGDTFMDWEITRDYCRKFAEAFEVPIYFSYKEGGFLKEMLRDNQATAPIIFQTPEGWKTTGGNGPKNTRKKFPQVSADLSVRWCSSYLKIDVCAAAIRNQERFNGLRTVVLSGERAEESKARSMYAVLEPDRSDLREGKKFQRYVDRWRPVLLWTEQQVWDIIEKYKVRAHPAYYLGWGRCSCKFCIFGSKDQFASAYKISPKIGDSLIELEESFGVTLKRKQTLKELIDQGTPYDMSQEDVKVALNLQYTEEIFMDEWVLPKGAFGESCGPM